MKQAFLLGIILLSTFLIQSQSFTRTQLSTTLNAPWEISTAPDDFLWLTEKGGIVSRVDPSTGDKIQVYIAPDYFDSSPLEISPLCPNLPMGRGTFGLTLHPDFSNPLNAFVYFVYSYNNGTEDAPSTKFRIKRLKWDADSKTVTDDTNIVNEIATGFDHWGGRLMAIVQNDIPYLYLTIGDNGRAEQDGVSCYDPPSSNPNNFAQDPSTQNGKVHRFNIDGSIPDDNPLPGNSFFTRGHRNPQGLMYNPNLDILYNVEHGDATDDEINVLQKGMNYGWKDVHGWHDDESFAGEANYVDDYVPNQLIEGDALVEPFYVWCTTPPEPTDTWTDWCTVAPSDGIYYGINGIPEWTNSLLVVTLKDGASTDKEVYQFQLENDGSLVPPTAENPNPKKFFGPDQAMNGRLRDISFSNDGKTIYLISNNGGIDTDAISVYTYVEWETGLDEASPSLTLFPNPVSDVLNIKGLESFSDAKYVWVSSTSGESVRIPIGSNGSIDVAELRSGLYFIQFTIDDDARTYKFVKL